MRFCNGIPNDRYRIVADENRWQVGSASPFRDGRGVQRIPSRYCGARLAALTFPPAPFLSPAGGEEGGGRCLPFPQPPSAPPWGADEKERRKLLTQWLRAGSAGLWPAS